MIARAPKFYSDDPIAQLTLSDSEGTPIILRRIPDQSGTVGANGAQFDELLRRWVGGAGITNVWWLMNIMPGTYDLYVYTGSLVTTTFTVRVNGGARVVATATPSGATSFVQNDNFVIFPNLVVPLTQRAISPAIYAGGMLELSVVGTISGLQLRRL